MQEKKTGNIRVRFAPAPSGFMHLGNVRTALINFLFAKQKQGTFVLRIEDTDTQRNMDPKAEKIISDLNWLNLQYNEGPVKGGPHVPYFQSQRTEIYKTALQELIKTGITYRCFCTIEELERKRQRQIALKQPPRYDKTCLKLTQEEIDSKLKNNTPFIWRVKIEQDQKIKFLDLAKGTLEFDLKNFSDFPITRQDGSFTFIFANCIDDIKMEITHIFRGEDHITNTVDQLVIFKAFGKSFPTYYHMPIICEKDGRKLSKRNFGFSLNDLQNAGYLPEAVCNYLAIIGNTFENEIQTLDDLSKNFNFENMHSTGPIKYDLEKLNWINHKWINLYTEQKLVDICLPFLKSAYPHSKIDNNILVKLLNLIKSELVTAKDCVKILNFYFEKPQLSKEQIQEKLSNTNLQLLSEIVQKNINLLHSPDEFVNQIKKEAKLNFLTLNTVFPFLRVALTGSIQGQHINDIINILGPEESKQRFENLIKIVS